MPTTEQLRSKLINKLKELFQLNQPDLDFGFYRIMHAKAEQVSNFIENDLLQVIQDTFGQADDAKKEKLKQELDNAIQTAIDFGAPDPEATPKVIEARARYEAIKDSATSEAEIYDHLYRFFERYYDDGDFISRRYYTRETPGKAAPFSIPYNGEEVKLHWANADQYYIKTTEYFANYTVNLTEAIKGLKESKKRNDEEIDLDDSSIPEGLKVHFRIVDATEGEHANVKASDATKRYFLIHKEKPIELNDKNELVINFEYKPTTDKTKQETLNQDAVALIIQTLKDMEPRNTQKSTEKDSIESLPCNSEFSVVSNYLSALNTSIPTEKDKDRILLTKYINQYTARNTMDYFIHKNLGAFLKRELDFYIKNEIMRLDDIENAEAPKVEDYLAKIKVLRKIAIKLIEFMAQLEDFQKKLWLKKKFVVETNYCITLDRVPEELYPQIIANKEQIEEWIKLYAIDDIEGDTTCPAYTNPPTLNFLKVNDKLLLDTRFFDEGFKAKLLSSIQGFDEQCDGLLIHSENSQALSLLQDRYKELIKCIYIDPPYNTAATEIMYKNEYKHSSWLALIADRVITSIPIMQQDGVICVAIDDVEGAKLQNLLSDIMGIENLLGIVVVVHNPGGRHDDTYIATSHEYCIYYGKDTCYTTTNLLQLEEKDIESFKHNDSDRSFRTREFRRSGNNSTREARPRMFYPLLIKDGAISLIDYSEYLELYNKDSNAFNDGFLQVLKTKYNDLGFDFFLPIDPQGIIRVWRWTPDTLLARISDVFAVPKGNGYVIKVKDWLDNKLGLKPKSVWYKAKYTAALGTTLLKSIMGHSTLFSYPKSVSTVEDSIRIASNDNDTIIDYFAGSGTTGHAVINLNREDNGYRRYILIEMGDYFDTVLKPRISKVVYCDEWKDGKPKNRDTGVSHCFKYLRLESYEDTLNNLVIQSDSIRNRTFADNTSLKEDYLLHYMLDVESKGSQSLLNIDTFNDPTSYVLKVKKPGSDEYIEKAVDLIETFNYLIGLRLVHQGTPQTLTAAFTRLPDPDVPHDQDTKLVIAGDGKLKTDPGGKWWIRKVEGWVPKNPYNPNDCLKDKVLIIWRNLTGNLEEDNLVLDNWFDKVRIKPSDTEFDIIYVNGSNNLLNLQVEGDTWKVRLIEEEFMKRMWEQCYQD